MDVTVDFSRQIEKKTRLGELIDGAAMAFHRTYGHDGLRNRSRAEITARG
jgi:hypothetical protein